MNSTPPKIPPKIRKAINHIVSYLAHDEIRHLSDCDGTDVDTHIAQSVIALAEWAGGEAWAAVEDEIEHYQLAELPSGRWAAEQESAPT